MIFWPIKLGVINMSHIIGFGNTLVALFWAYRSRLKILIIAYYICLLKIVKEIIVHSLTHTWSTVTIINIYLLTWGLVMASDWWWIVITHGSIEISLLSCRCFTPADWVFTCLGRSLLRCIQIWINSILSLHAT